MPLPSHAYISIPAAVLNNVWVWVKSVMNGHPMQHASICWNQIDNTIRVRRPAGGWLQRQDQQCTKCDTGTQWLPASQPLAQGWALLCPPTDVTRPTNCCANRLRETGLPQLCNE